MDVTAEAKQIMVQALSKMYSSRTQRGGLRLHRSLLLTLVMKSARDIYHTARLMSERNGQSDTQCVTEDSTAAAAEEPMETSSSTAALLREISPPQSAEDGQRSGLELGHPHGHTADKENCSSARPDRHSRKRRSKTATDPDFIPCKKAKLEFAEVRVVIQSNCGRALDSLSLVPMPRTIVTF